MHDPDDRDFQDPQEHIPDYERFEQEQLAQERTHEEADIKRERQEHTWPPDGAIAAGADDAWADSPPAQEPHRRLLRDAGQAAIAQMHDLEWCSGTVTSRAGERHVAVTVASAVLRAALDTAIPAMDWHGGPVDLSIIPAQGIRDHLVDVETALNDLSLARKEDPLHIAACKVRAVRVTLDKALGIGDAANGSHAVPDDV